MVRISPGQVYVAYAQHPDIRPERQVYWDNTKEGEIRCCGLMACAYDAGAHQTCLAELGENTEESDFYSVFEEYLGISRPYVNGYMHGFDGNDVCPGNHPTGTDGVDFELGREDGKAAAALIFQETMCVTPGETDGRL